MSTGDSQIGVNTNLQKQDLSNLDVSNLTPLSPEVISRQATINIGTIGHVAHGKSTVVKAISGVQTVRFKNELERNITIKLERLSEERLQAILKSPLMLRAYEKHVEATVKKFALQRQDHLNSRSQGRRKSLRPRSLIQNQITSCQQTLKQLMQFQRCITLRNITSSPSSGYETLTENGSIYSMGDHGETCSLSVTSPEFKKSANYRKRAKSLTGQNNQNLSNIPLISSSAKDAMKRRVSQSALMENKENSKETDEENPLFKGIKKPRGEYVVENIECVESLNGSPLFYVKWYNYPPEQNTWESFENISECEVLEKFIEERSAFFEVTIASISADIEAEIEREGIIYNANNIKLHDLDTFEPLLLKIDLILLAQFRDAKSRQIREPEKIRKRVIDLMLLKPYYYLRKRQKMDLDAWEKRVNKIEFAVPIKIENTVDLDVPDPNFCYILESFPGKSVSLTMSVEPPPIGCKCEDGICLPTSKCCGRMADTYFAYDKKGRLRIRTGEAIYECNTECNCDQSCRNRVIQHGRKNSLCVFKTPNNCGWGLRTERPMFKGEYVCEYVGEIISSEEANERGKLYDDIGRTYLFDLDYNTNAESVYTIDAALHGNISHFINHSCDPNLAVFPFWINNLDVNLPRLAFFTLRPIKAGEELTFDYVRPSATTTDNNVYQNLSTAKKVSCRCGAENCRKVLF